MTSRTLYDYSKINDIKDVAAEIKKQHRWAARTIDKLHAHVRVYVCQSKDVVADTEIQIVRCEDHARWHAH